MARHNKILSDKLNCPICDGLNMETYIKARWEKSGNYISLNHICHHCGGRIRITENVNGFLILRKYVMRKDKIKREKK